MSYSLRNKTLAVVALAFTLMIATSYFSHAQNVPNAQAPTPISEDIDIFGTGDDSADPSNDLPIQAMMEKDAAERQSANPTEADIPIAPDAPVADVAPASDTPSPLDGNPPANPADDFLNDVTEDNSINPVEANPSNQTPPVNPEMPVNPAMPNPMPPADPSAPAPMPDAGPSPAPDGLLSDTAPVADNEPASGDSGDTSGDAIPATEAPKSPFESFGNAILAKVDNDLFNQMSNIEKQTTILNLELKREELKNRVEALKAARQRALEEEEERRKDAEEKRKEREAERQAKIIAEQEKLKQREIELEKVRQARVLNEYMNEMLLINQKWVSKNAVLQSRINELEKERMDLIKDFEKKSADVYREISSIRSRAESAVASHERVVTSLNAQITQLRKSVIENEDRYKKLKEGNTTNPFASNQPGGGLTGLDENAVDMSDEYAIMDITGKGDNIIAKIVNSEGTTFIVHKGSMLKGGEVVTAITDNYIAFDNKGIKSYLYTGGTVMEFEPTVSFNDSDKMPEATTKNIVKSEVRNVLGGGSSKAPSAAPAAPLPLATPAAAPTLPSPGSKKGGSSAASGMFVR